MSKIYKSIKEDDLNEFIGSKARLYEDNERIIEGTLSSTYWGTCNHLPCIGVVIDNGSGFLLDDERKLEIL